jgi:hypothetical protein
VKASTSDPNLLRSVRPADLAAYLRARHWVPEERDDDRDWFWTLPGRSGEEIELLVPLKPDFKDYPLRVSEVLETLGMAESRPLADILRDVVTVTYDLIRVRVDNPRYADGSLKLDDGVSLFDNARKLMASAARSAYDPRPQFVAGMPNEVTDYLNRVRLGQTERGSYIVNLLSPTMRFPEQDQLFPTERFEREGSFERRVTHTLARALVAARSAVGQSVEDPLMKKFEEAVPVGVSANLCEAIAEIGQSGRDTGVEIDLRWALSRPVEGREDLKVYFRAIDIPVIREAGKLLRSTPSREERIEGYVVRLTRERGLGDEGTVSIQSLIEDKLRRITVELPPSAYQRAVRAHEADRKVACYGKLQRRGKTFFLREPRGLEILDDSGDDAEE